MTKAELISAVSEKQGIKKIEAEKLVEAVFETMTEALVSEGIVSIVGFGSFEVKSRAERMGHNPQTGEAITIPANKALTFKVGSNLRASINK